MNKNISLFLTSIVFMFFCITGCGSSSSGSSNDTTENTIKISGNLGTTYAFYKTKWYDNIFKSSYAGTFGTVKKAIAIPMIYGFPQIGYAKEITIKNDGSFEIDLSKTMKHEGTTYEQNYMILIEKQDGTINFLSIPKDSSAGSETLVNLPTSKATSNIELGTVNSNTNEAKSTLNLDGLSAKVSYNVNELQSLATFDDSLKSILNLYKNSYGKSNDEIVSETLHVVSKGDYSKINSDYAIANEPQGYSFHFYAGKNSSLAKNFETICNNNNYLQLIPPNDVKTGAGNTYSSSNPFKSTNAAINPQTDGSKHCLAGISYVQKDTDGELVSNFIIGDTSDKLATTTPIPSGDFELQLNGTSIGKYDLSYNLPFTADNKLKTPIPSIKLNLDADNKVQGVYVKWYVHNTNEDEEINLNALKSILQDFSISMDDFNGKTGNTSRLTISCNDISINTNYVDISKCSNYQSLYYNYNNEDKYSLDDVNVVINFSSNELRFTYRRN